VKVLVDTNVLLSYLLAPTGTSAVVEVVERLLTGQDDLVLPEEVLRELVKTTLNKPYFAERVPAKSVRALVEILTALSTPSPSPESLDRNWVRDPKDDFLIMAALLAEADYLISGDKDLIALGDSLAPLKIRSPQAFIDEIGRA
jgi:putative PIN family toxin of toxin-antitoxin system